MQLSCLWLSQQIRGFNVAIKELENKQMFSKDTSATDTGMISHLQVQAGRKISIFFRHKEPAIPSQVDQERLMKRQTTTAAINLSNSKAKTRTIHFPHDEQILWNCSEVLGEMTNLLCFHNELRSYQIKMNISSIVLCVVKHRTLKHKQQFHFIWV